MSGESHDQSLGDGDYQTEELRQVNHITINQSLGDGDQQREDHRQVSHMVSLWGMVITKERIIVM